MSPKMLKHLRLSFSSSPFTAPASTIFYMQTLFIRNDWSYPHVLPIRCSYEALAKRKRAAIKKQTARRKKRSVFHEASSVRKVFVIGGTASRSMYVRIRENSNNESNRTNAKGMWNLKAKKNVRRRNGTDKKKKESQSLGFF